MLEKNIVIRRSDDHEFGLPTAVVSAASQFSSVIEIEMGEKKVNAKSMMGMTYMMLIDGDEVTLRCSGKDEEKAIEYVEKVLTK